jgi:hypothetical protein
LRVRESGTPIAPIGTTLILLEALTTIYPILKPSARAIDGSALNYSPLGYAPLTIFSAIAL